MQQASDFLEETEILFELIKDFTDNEFEQKTFFKNWTINDILVHLHFWNMSAYSSLNEPEQFDKMMKQFLSAVQTGKLRSYENSVVVQRWQAILKLWYGLSKKLANDFLTVDPKLRVKWAGPDMSARTCISARQMETWAHGQAIFDLLGKDRSESDRIKNIVVLGVNAFGWSHQVHQLDVPQSMPLLKLKSPSTIEWIFGEPTNENLIEGDAVEFSQVVAQTRNIADTSLRVVGNSARVWMANAQCFAGPPEMPPERGLRKKLSR